MNGKASFRHTLRRTGTLYPKCTLVWFDQETGLIPEIKQARVISIFDITFLSRPFLSFPELLRELGCPGKAHGICQGSSTVRSNFHKWDPIVDKEPTSRTRRRPLPRPIDPQPLANMLQNTRCRCKDSLPRGSWYLQQRYCSPSNSPHQYWNRTRRPSYEGQLGTPFRLVQYRRSKVDWSWSSSYPDWLTQLWLLSTPALSTYHGIRHLRSTAQDSDGISNQHPWQMNLWDFQDEVGNVGCMNRSQPWILTGRS